MLQNEDIKPRLATRFLIKAGGLKQKGDTTYPEKWDHIKVCSPDRDDVGNPTHMDEWMMENLGTKTPTEVPFMFFTNDPTQCYDDGYAYRTKTQRLCYSTDGRIAWWSKSKREGKSDKKNPVPEGITTLGGSSNETEDAIAVKCPGPGCPMQASKKCKINLRLTGFIPRPEEDFKFQGADVFYSSSYNSASQLRGSLQTLISLTGGNIAFVPLTLRLSPKKAMAAGRQVQVYVMSFFPDESVDKLNARSIESGGPPATDLALPHAVPDFDENVEPDEYYSPETESTDSTLPSYEEMSPDTTSDSETESIEVDLDAEIAAMKRDIFAVGRDLKKKDEEVKGILIACDAEEKKDIYDNLRNTLAGLRLMLEPSLPGMD